MTTVAGFIRGLLRRFTPRNDDPLNDLLPEPHTALGIAAESPERVPKNSGERGLEAESPTRRGTPKRK
jgi:hypothetical protein